MPYEGSLAIIESLVYWAPSGNCTLDRIANDKLELPKTN